jgi:hypothetical protein
VEATLEPTEVVRTVVLTKELTRDIEPPLRISKQLAALAVKVVPLPYTRPLPSAPTVPAA